METNALKEQIDLLCIERGLDKKEIMSAMEIAIASAYRKELGEREAAYEANYDLEENKYSIYRIHNIVDEVVAPERELSLVEARLTNPQASEEDVIREKLEVDKDIDFGRIASQIAKQVLIQSVNNARHTKVLKRFKNKIGGLVTVEIDYYRKGGYVVKFDQTQGFISKENLLPTDRFKPGQLIKCLIADIAEDDKRGLRILLSRTDNDFVRAIVAQEIPEVRSGVVTIEKIAREPGSRTKMIVSVNEEENQDIDPVGTILGRRNVRILNIMREISTSLQEKIDVIELQENDLDTMIMDALEPAEIEEIEYVKDEESGEESAIAHCYSEEAALAVGRRGVNVRLASKLLDMPIKIQAIETEGGEKAEKTATVDAE